MEVIIMTKPNEQNIQYVTNSYFFTDYGGGGGNGRSRHSSTLFANCIMHNHATC